MFRHKGKTRTYQHNLQIASLLSFVAGTVNVAGFLSVQTLTTNVTGHFAFLVDEVFKLDFWMALIYFLLILFFFLGSFVSNFLIELAARKNDHHIYTFPASLECIILLLVGIWGHLLLSTNSHVISFSLLFAMGLQNSLVTSISNSRVRTTHLTGLFTDLGIEISQLFFFKEKNQKRALLSSIRLRFTIIFFFFAGGIIGGVLYSSFGLLLLVFSGVILAVGLVYDNIKYNIIFLRRKFKSCST